AELATELENPEKPLTALIVYAAAAVVIGIITNRSTAARRFINGTPAILMKNGRMNRRAFKHAKLDIDEFLMISRVAGYFNIGDIRLALLEHNGKISFQPYSDLRPASPADLGIHPEKAVSFYEIIKDGRIDENTLKRSGFDRSWVERQLAAQHYALKDIMLGVCDKNGSLAIYPEEKGK
ncbi:MAG: DUF421 domain-containing protein, partial [Firmicutes bacterium]|nr:DUF421 domain-containing protein [Bacillota bacterium]